MARLLRPNSRDDFEIAIICALKVERDAIEALLDEEYETDGFSYGKAAGDSNAYTTGRLGNQHVVLAYMPGMGMTSTAAVACNIRSSFERIKVGIVVGICGGVPKTADGVEILLGDVIISASVVQIDFGRQYPNKFIRKDTAEDTLGRSNPEIRALMGKAEGNRIRGRLQEKTSLFTAQVYAKDEFRMSAYPGPENDTLYPQDYRHKHQVQGYCAICDNCQNQDREVCENALRASCVELGCDDKRSIERKRVQKAMGLATDGSQITIAEITDAQKPSIHFGRIACSNQVMKSGQHRDRIAAEEGVIGFEMESAGTWDYIPTIVIKSVCDYADSHKNKQWQEYAAATAAACTKAFLEEWRAVERQSPVSQKPCWTVGFQRNPWFVGRSSEIVKIDTLLSSQNRCERVAIIGLGGVGKTQIALEYAYRWRERFPDSSVFWMPATNMESMQETFLEVGRQLGIPKVTQNQEDIQSLVGNRLNQEASGRWLLIFDNADDIDLWTEEPSKGTKSRRLIDKLPQSRLGSIIFTTRSRKAAVKLAGKILIDVDAMDELTAKETLSNCLVDQSLLNDEQSTLELLHELTFLPLAIVQAAAYINENQITICEYTAMLRDTEQEAIDILSEDFEDEGRYPGMRNSIATTWLVSFEHIRRQDPLSADFLSIMSFFDAKNIPQTLLPPTQSAKKTIDAIGTLCAYSFVTKHHTIDNQAVRLFDLHRLVHLATRNWLLREGNKEEWAARALERLNEVFPDSKDENRASWRMYLPHARYFLESGVCEGMVRERMRLLQKFGHCVYKDGRYNEAEKTDLQVVENHKKLFGAEHPDTLTSMGNLALTFWKQGRWKEAEEIAVQVTKLKERVLGTEHPKTLSSKANLAVTYWEQGRWKEAEELQVQVMEWSLRVLGAEHPKTLSSRDSLASTYWKQGRWKEAEELQVQVMETRKRVLGAEHPKTLSSRANLASTFLSQGRLEEAEELGVQVMELRERVLGTEHPKTLSSRASLATTYWKQGRWKEAEELQVQVMETRKRVLGAEHPKTMSSRANLAATYREQGRWKEAEELQVQVMEWSLRVLGTEHPETLSSRVMLATTYWKQGRWKEAEELEVQVVETNKRVLGAEHPSTLTSIANLASTFSSQGRLEEAEGLEVQVIETSTRLLGTEHPATLTSMNNLAWTWKMQGRGVEALNLMKECVQLRTRILGVNHPDTLSSSRAAIDWQLNMVIRTSTAHEN